MDSRQILVADDDRLILATLVRGLGNAGFHVTPARSGAEAVAAGVRERPALAVMDIRMPDLSGIEAARRLREEAGVPSMFLSAYNDAELVAEAAREGALGYVVKPVDVPQLVPAIETALSRAGEIDELKRSRTELSAALAQRREVSVATGVLMERLHLSESEAFEGLRACARAQRRKLLDVARELVAAADRLDGIAGEVARHCRRP